MCKVGIVTNYRNINYGSALQAYALQSVVNGFDYSCEHIFYFRGKTIFQRLKRLVQNPLLLLNKLDRAREKLVPSGVELRRQKFGGFVSENINESRKVVSLSELKVLGREYASVICGSDQIWAPNQFHEWYYIHFVSDSRRKIAYAPSIGLPQIPEHLKAKMSSLVKDIGFLSIREREGAEILKELTGLDVPVVLDPTLLVTSAQWRKKTQVERDNLFDYNERPYCFCLFLGENPKHREVVSEYCDSAGLDVITVPFRECDFSFGDRIESALDPFEFLALLDRSAIVFTDSFHGAAFSVNFNKPFYVFPRFKAEDPLCQNSRIRNLVNMFGLEERLIENEVDSSSLNSQIDFSVANKALEKERESSLSFLKNSLEKSTERL